MSAKRLFILAALLGAALPAAAASSLTANHGAFAQTRWCCGDGPPDIVSLSGPGPLDATSWASRATAQGTPDYGLLTGAVSASASRFSGYTNVQSNGTIRDIWGDEITIASAGLAAGTPVQVQVTVALDYSATQQSTSGASTNLRATAALHFNGPDAPWITGVTYEPGAGGLQGSASSTLTGEASFASHVGATFHLFGDLLLVTAAFADINPSSASASLSGTARYTVSVLTPGAGVASASGAAYVTPVPEPQTAALLLAGLACMGALLRRRNTAAAPARTS